jgi:hypothetical protein
MANQLAHLFRHGRSPAYRVGHRTGENPLRCQPTTVEALTIKTLDCQSFQTALSQAQSNRSAGVSFGRWTETLKNAELMAEREDLELERRTAPKKCGQKADKRARRGIEGRRTTLSVHQSERILREPQFP